MATFNGTAGDDIYGGTAGADTIHGNGGNDTLFGAGGNDTINGGIGADFLLGGLGLDTINGGDGDDILCDNDYYYSPGGSYPIVDTSRDTLNGGNGNDILMGGPADVFDGGAGTDIALIDLGSTNGVTIDLRPLNTGGTATLPSSGSIRNVEGGIAIYFGTGSNVAYGSDYVEELYGWTGNDTFDGGGGDDYLDGWTGNDTLIGGAGNDTLLGGEGNDTLSGGDGQDLVHSGTGVDALDGGADTDGLILDRAASVLAFTIAAASFGVGGVTLVDGTNAVNFEFLNITTGSGNDTFDLTGYSAPSSIFNAGLGFDTLIADWSALPATPVMTLSGFERFLVQFGGGNDTFSGGNADDVLGGNGGNDTLYGGAGNDTLSGGAGNDTFDAGSGVDSIDGGADQDTLVLNRSSATHAFSIVAADFASNGGVTLTDGSSVRNVEVLHITTGAGEDTFDLTGYAFTQGSFNAGAGFDTLIADWSGLGALPAIGMNGFERYLVQLTSGNDIFTGGSSDDVLYGNAGGDTLSGGGGGDTLDGGADNDVLHGGDGDNTLRGGTGDDGMSTGIGASDIDGGEGQDTLTLQHASSSTGVTYYSGVDTGGGATFSDGTQVKNVEWLQVWAGTGDDTFVYSATTAFVSFNAGAGNDLLVADFSASNQWISLNDTYARLLINGNVGAPSAEFNGVESFHVNGGSAGDRLFGGSGGDVLNGNGGVDILYGYAGADVLDGGDGDDDINGGLGNDTLRGGAGNDVINAREGVDEVDGGDGVDKVYLDLSSLNVANTISTETLLGGGDLTFANGAVVRNCETFSVFAGGGDDTFHITGPLIGANTFFGGGGYDRLYIDFSASNEALNLSQSGPSQMGGGGWSAVTAEFEYIHAIGSAFDDVMSGDYNDDVLIGGGGNDELWSYAANGVSAGVDILDGGDGVDKVVLDFADSNFDNVIDASAFATAQGQVFGNGTVVRNIETFQIWGGAGADTLYVSSGDLVGSNVFIGRNGFDQVIVDLSSESQEINLVSGSLTVTGQAWSLSYAVEQIELFGGSADDWLQGGAQSNILHGGAGNDSLQGSGGADVLHGDAGDDTLEGWDGNDRLYGGQGNDSLNGIWGDNILDGGEDDDTVNGGTGNDLLIGGLGVDQLLGGEGDDFLFSDVATSAGIGQYSWDINQDDNSADVIDGGAGVDRAFVSFVNATGSVVFSNANSSALNVITVGGSALGSITNVEGVDFAGGAFADTLTGGAGADALYGNGGNDLLCGLGGDDTFNGGAGSDTVIWNGARAGFFIRTLFVNGQFVTEIIDQTGGEGGDASYLVETFRFNGVNYAIAGVQQNRQSNFDGGRFDDVLFHNAATGEVWSKGGNDDFAVVIGALDAGWAVRAFGDVNGDGKADVIAQNTANGSIYFYDGVVNGAGSWKALVTNLNATYEVIDAGDVTGDGVVDVLVRQNNANGTLLYLDIESGGVKGAWGGIVNIGQTWRAVALGDFNFDGKSDVLVQEIATGRTYCRDIAGNAWGNVNGGPGAAWVAKAAGDINGDGYYDVVFQNSNTGNVWWMNMAGGAGENKWGVVANSMTGWDVIDVMDVDNDGWGDVVMQNQSNGETYYANMDNGAFSGWGFIAGAIGTDWDAV